MIKLPLISSLLVGVSVGVLSMVFIPIWCKLIESVSGHTLRRAQDLEMRRADLEFAIRVSGVLCVLTLVIGWISGTIILAAATIGVLFLVTPYYLANQVQKHSSLLRDQIAGVSTALANSSRAGLALPSAFEVAANESPPPISQMLARIVSDYSMGRPMNQILDEYRSRLNLDEFTLLTAAVLTCDSQGGDMPLTLERIAASLKEHQRLRRKIESDTAEGKMVVLVLSIFPVIFLVAFLLLYPSGSYLYFTTLVGQLMLVVIGLVILGAAYWCKRIMLIDV